MDPTEALSWYLAPWRRINRATFNVVFFLATLPSLFFGIGHTASFIAPILNTASEFQNVSTSDPAALTGMLNNLQTPASTPQQGEPFPWEDLFGMAVMVALIPLVMGRARDAGHTPTTVKVLTGLAMAATITGLLKLLMLPTLGLGIPAAIASFLVITYLCIIKSAPAQPVNMTTPRNPANLPADDDYPNPFKRP